MMARKNGMTMAALHDSNGPRFRRKCRISRTGKEMEIECRLLQRPIAWRELRLEPDASRQQVPLLDGAQLRSLEPSARTAKG